MEALAKWVQTYQAIIAIVLGVIGWIANHQLTLRAQSKNFRKQLYNTARIDINTSLRQYEEYLIMFRNYCIAWVDKSTKEEEADDGFPITIFDYWDSNAWQNEIKTFDKVMEHRTDKWQFTMREYITLIPDLGMAYDLINERDKEIQKHLNLIQQELKYIYETRFQDIGLILSSIDASKEAILYINEQIGLVQDLLVYLQNKCFSEIVGSQLKKPLSETEQCRPKFIIKKDRLIYVNNICNKE